MGPFFLFLFPLQVCNMLWYLCKNGGCEKLTGASLEQAPRDIFDQQIEVQDNGLQTMDSHKGEFGFRSKPEVPQERVK